MADSEEEEAAVMADSYCDEDDDMSLTQFYLSRRKPYSSEEENQDDNHQPLSMVDFFNRAEEASSSYKQQTHESATDDEATLFASEREDEDQDYLSPNKIPPIVKTMMPSHVTKGFWLGLPSGFCKAHLPKQDVTVTLVDENGEKYCTRYLPHKIGLSGGWKNFVVTHSLVVGDTVVFQLVDPTTFKVHITRDSGHYGSDGAIDLTLDSHSTRTNIEVNSAEVVRKQQSKRISVSSPRDEPKIVRKRQRKRTSVSSPRDKPGSDADDVEGIRFVEGSVDFKDVKDKKSFSIAVNGLVIDSELSIEDWTKYYKLCRSQGSFLHENLRHGINIKLAAGAISQTVQIADAIKESKMNTSRNEFEAWDEYLQGLEMLGMNVRFLHARLKKLVRIAYDSEEMVEAKQYNEAVASRADVEKEVRFMKAKLANLRSSLKRLDTQIKTMEEKNAKQMSLFQAEVNAPW